MHRRFGKRAQFLLVYIREAHPADGVDGRPSRGRGGPKINQPMTFRARQEAARHQRPARDLDRLAGYAVRYYEDFVAPAKVYRAPDERERAAFEDFVMRLDALPADTKDTEILQTTVFDAGKTQSFENLRDWFRAIYEVCFGQSQGPRMGSFIAIYGVRETAELIRKALER